MGCARGRSLDCSNDYTTGGLSDILIADAADVDNFTQNADGSLATSNSYTAVTMVSSGVFNTISFADDTAVFEEPQRQRHAYMEPFIKIRLEKADAGLAEHPSRPGTLRLRAGDHFPR